jgi:hypothetical protein
MLYKLVKKVDIYSRGENGVNWTYEMDEMEGLLFDLPGHLDGDSFYSMEIRKYVIKKTPIEKLNVLNIGWTFDVTWLVLAKKDNKHLATIKEYVL